METAWGLRNVCKLWSEGLQGTGHLENLGTDERIKLKMDIKRKWMWSSEEPQMVQDRVQQWCFVNTVMNIPVPLKLRNSKINFNITLLLRPFYQVYLSSLEVLQSKFCMCFLFHSNMLHVERALYVLIYCKLWTSSLCNFLSSTATSSPLVPNILIAITP